jgi:hypothetical protein
MARITQPLTFYSEVLKALEDIGAPYMIIGAFAAAAYGSERVTHDVDMIVILADSHMTELAARFPAPRYYADPEQMRNAQADGTLFNVIDSERGEKVDLIPWTLDERYAEAFDRRIRLAFEDLNGELIDAWYARADDVIVGKLMAWNEGHSVKHQYDIAAMMYFMYQGADPTLAPYFDEKYVDKKAKSISPDALAFWRKLKREAKAGLKKRQS